MACAYLRAARALAAITLVALLSWDVACVGAARDPFKGSADIALHTDAAPENDRVLLLTPYGRIFLRLLPKNAPNAVAAVQGHAERHGCTEKCKFYRTEARPRSDLDESPEGPPYALLQGSLDLAAPPKSEGNLDVKAGHVAFIPDTSDFFIALADHPDWGTSHTVFAEVEDFVSTDLIGAQFYHKETHPEFGTVMRMMDKPVQFKITSDLEQWVM